MYAKSATTITNILEAAQRLFVEKNYAEVTMSDIAEAAEVTKGALYHHFDSKESLYMAMMLADLAEKKALIRTAVELEGTSRQRLRHLTVSFLDLADQKREAMQLVRRDINIFKNPMREQLVRAYQEALPVQVEAIIRDGLSAGEFAPADARLLSWQFVAMVEVVLSDYARRVLGNDNQKLADYILDMFFQGARGEE